MVSVRASLKEEASGVVWFVSAHPTYLETICVLKNVSQNFIVLPKLKLTTSHDVSELEEPSLTTERGMRPVWLCSTTSTMMVSNSMMYPVTIPNPSSVRHKQRISTMWLVLQCTGREPLLFNIYLWRSHHWNKSADKPITCNYLAIDELTMPKWSIIIHPCPYWPLQHWMKLTVQVIHFSRSMA